MFLLLWMLTALRVVVARVQNFVACSSAARVARIIAKTNVLVCAPSTRAQRPHAQKAFNQHRRMVREEKDH